jgi:hypothetical protein
MVTFSQVFHFFLKDRQFLSKKKERKRKQAKKYSWVHFFFGNQEEKICHKC